MPPKLCPTSENLARGSGSPAASTRSRKNGSNVRRKNVTVSSSRRRQSQSTTSRLRLFVAHHSMNPGYSTFQITP